MLLIFKCRCITCHISVMQWHSCTMQLFFWTRIAELMCAFFSFLFFFLVNLLNTAQVCPIFQKWPFIRLIESISAVHLPWQFWLCISFWSLCFLARWWVCGLVGNIWRWRVGSGLPKPVIILHFDTRPYPSDWWRTPRDHRNRAWNCTPAGPCEPKPPITRPHLSLICSAFNMLYFSFRIDHFMLLYCSVSFVKLRYDT